MPDVAPPTRLLAARCRPRGTDRRCTPDPPMLWTPPGCSSQRAAPVLTAVGAHHGPLPSLLHAVGLDAPSALAPPDSPLPTTPAAAARNRCSRAPVQHGARSSDG